MSVTVLLADDHAIMRDGLNAVITSQPDFKVIAHAANGRQAVALAAQYVPDIVIMDIGMPDLNGVEACRRILKADPKVRVVALSTYVEKEFVEAMLAAGARAYVVKSSAADQLLTAMRQVLAGQIYLCPQVAPVADEILQGRTPQRDNSARGLLTDRELEILQLVAEGHASRPIADKLGIAEHTVDVHRRNIMRKLDLHNVADLTRYAIREHLTSP